LHVGLVRTHYIPSEKKREDRQIPTSRKIILKFIHRVPTLESLSSNRLVPWGCQYTPEAKRASIEGTVVLYIQVYPGGRAHNIKVQSSLGSGLDAKAIEAVQQWRFSPGTKHGKPVVVPATIEVKFRLNDTSEPCRAGSPQTEPKPQNGRV
jgi:TonB family protein